MLAISALPSTPAHERAPAAVAPHPFPRTSRTPMQSTGANTSSIGARAERPETMRARESVSNRTHGRMDAPARSDEPGGGPSHPQTLVSYRSSPVASMPSIRSSPLSSPSRAGSPSGSHSQALQDIHRSQPTRQSYSLRDPSEAEPLISEPHRNKTPAARPRTPLFGTLSPSSPPAYSPPARWLPTGVASPPRKKRKVAYVQVPALPSGSSHADYLTRQPSTRAPVVSGGPEALTAALNRMMENNARGTYSGSASDSDARPPVPPPARSRKQPPGRRRSPTRSQDVIEISSSGSGSGTEASPPLELVSPQSRGVAVTPRSVAWAGRQAETRPDRRAWRAAGDAAGDAEDVFAAPSAARTKEDAPRRPRGHPRGGAGAGAASAGNNPPKRVVKKPVFAQPVSGSEYEDDADEDRSAAPAPRQPASTSAISAANSKAGGKSTLDAAKKARRIVSSSSDDDEDDDDRDYNEEQTRASTSGARRGKRASSAEGRPDASSSAKMSSAGKTSAPAPRRSELFWNKNKAPAVPQPAAKTRPKEASNMSAGPVMPRSAVAPSASSSKAFAPDGSTASTKPFVRRLEVDGRTARHPQNGGASKRKPTDSMAPPPPPSTANPVIHTITVSRTLLSLSPKPEEPDGEPFLPATPDPSHAQPAPAPAAQHGVPGLEVEQLAPWFTVLRVPWDDPSLADGGPRAHALPPSAQQLWAAERARQPRFALEFARAAVGMLSPELRPWDDRTDVVEDAAGPDPEAWIERHELEYLATLAADGAPAAGAPGTPAQAGPSGQGASTAMQGFLASPVSLGTADFARQSAAGAFDAFYANLLVPDPDPPLPSASNSVASEPGAAGLSFPPFALDDIFSAANDLPVTSTYHDAASALDGALRFDGSHGVRMDAPFMGDGPSSSPSSLSFFAEHRPLNDMPDFGSAAPADLPSASTSKAPSSLPSLGSTSFPSHPSGSDADGSRSPVSPMTSATSAPPSVSAPLLTLDPAKLRPPTPPPTVWHFHGRRTIGGGAPIIHRAPGRGGRVRKLSERARVVSLADVDHREEDQDDGDYRPSVPAPVAARRKGKQREDVPGTTRKRRRTATTAPGDEEVAPSPLQPTVSAHAEAEADAVLPRPLSPSTSPVKRAVDGRRAKYCHQCRGDNDYRRMNCSTCKANYCQKCVDVRYPQTKFERGAQGWSCPRCTKTCNCSKCSKGRGEEYLKPSRKRRKGVPPGVRASAVPAAKTAPIDSHSDADGSRASSRPLAWGGAATPEYSPTPDPPAPFATALPERAAWGTVFAPDGVRRGVGLVAPGGTCVALPAPRARVFVGAPQQAWALARVADRSPSPPPGARRFVGFGRALVDAEWAPARARARNVAPLPPAPVEDEEEDDDDDRSSTLSELTPLPDYMAGDEDVLPAGQVPWIMPIDDLAQTLQRAVDAVSMHSGSSTPAV